MDAVRRQPDAPWDAQAHLQDLEAIERMLARYRHVNDEVLGRGDAFGEVVAGSLVLAPDELSEFFERARSASEDLSRTSALMDGLRERAALGVDEMLSTVIRGLPTVAKAVDKPDPVVFIDGGDVGFDPTIANAMDVGSPSNLERLTWLFDGDVGAMRSLITSTAHTDDEVRAAIAELDARYGYVADPHTAIAYLGDAPMFLSTAHPAKFREVVEPAIGKTVPLPAPLAAALARKKSVQRIGAAINQLADLL